MDLFEYQGKQYFARYGIPVSPGGLAVTPDELGDPQTLNVEVRVNGETRSRGDTREMLFSFEEIIAYARDRLAPYKVPKTVELIDTMPRSEATKVNRSKLIEAREPRPAGDGPAGTHRGPSRKGVLP